ncbi:hypothetical protein TSH100_04130 [Azospirillum sp. TSH100]|uniref:hypothetical protein n=1 Tax=Azospirillum sp. TSH100 TaxID=652764 RepID=UPI000D613BE0|nr:hypothetical protein [Azospirillum sp. TSH100]PWC89833.1 hypothetical protein TSH100_04130 [Azospirillum sp. TSH100]QCG92311.1 hypothetical protein E6C72_31385 [Azospirillum sp. TSH100]
MLRILQTDIGSVITARLASAITAIVAGGGGDNAPINGLVIDRQALGMPSSALVTLGFTATLGAGKTLSIPVFKVQDSADGVTFADFSTITTPGVVRTASGSGQVTGKVCLTGARRHVRVVFQADLSAADTDTASLVAHWAFGGFATLPSPA